MLVSSGFVGIPSLASTEEDWRSRLRVAAADIFDSGTFATGVQPLPCPPRDIKTSWEISQDEDAGVGLAFTRLSGETRPVGRDRIAGIPALTASGIELVGKIIGGEFVGELGRDRKVERMP